MHAAYIGREMSPFLARFPAPIRMTSTQTVAQRTLLRVQAPFFIGASHTADTQARASNPLHRTHPQMGTHTAGKLQGDQRIIIDLHTHAASIDLRVDLACPAKEHQGLVDQVAAQVVEQATSLFWLAQFAPGAMLGNGTITLVARLV